MSESRFVRGIEALRESYSAPLPSVMWVGLSPPLYPKEDPARLKFFGEVDAYITRTMTYRKNPEWLLFKNLTEGQIGHVPTLYQSEIEVSSFGKMLQNSLLTMIQN